MDQNNPKDCRTHVKVLLDFLRLCAIPNVPELLELCNPDNSVQSISHTNSWFLFTPGTLVVQQSLSLHDSMVFLVVSISPPRLNMVRDGRPVHDSLQLICQTVDYDGNIFAVRQIPLDIDHFEGVVSFSKLAIVPLRFLERPDGTRDSLVSRGQKFWDLRGQHMKEFVDNSYANRSLAVRLS